jgi:hypothetical protein
MAAHFGQPVAWGMTFGAKCVGAAVLVLAALLSGGTSATEPAEARASARQAVRLVIDYGDGVEKHFTHLAWREGATVFGIIQAATKHPRGIEVKSRGKGATLLITEIDGLAGEAAGAGSRNWIYRINGQIGVRSAGIAPVKAGDTVLWSFEAYR